MTNTHNAPQGGISVGITVGTCYSATTPCANQTVTTAPDGTYSVSVQPGSYTVAPTGLPSGTRSSPLNASVPAAVGQDATQNFSLTTGPVVSSVSPPAGVASGGESITVDGAGFGAAGTADTVQFCPASSPCQSGLDVNVVSDSVLTVTTPDMSGYQQPPQLLPADTVVTNPPGTASPEGSDDIFDFGCSPTQFPDGTYTINGCFAQLNPTTEQTAQNFSVDGMQVPASGSSTANVNTGSSPAVIPQVPSSLSLKLGPNLAPLMTGLSNVNLAAPVTGPAAPGAKLAGMAVTGTVSISPQNGSTTTATGNATVSLPAIFGGGKGSLTFTTSAGSGVTGMVVTASNAENPSVAKLFGLSTLTLTWNGGGVWTVGGSGNANGSTFTLSGSVGYNNNYPSSGSLTLAGPLSIGGVFTFSNLVLSYGSGTWSASAVTNQGPGPVSFSLPDNGQSTLNAGATVQIVGPVSFFGAINLSKFAMTYSTANGGTWSAEAEATGANGQKVGLKVQTGSDGSLAGFSASLAGFTIFNTIVLNKFDLSYSPDSAGNPEYKGSASVSFGVSPAAQYLVGASGTEFQLNFDFDNGSFKSGGFAFNSSLGVPVGAGIFLTGGGLTINRISPLSMTGSVNLTFGPDVDGISAFGMVANLTYVGAAMLSTPPQISLGGRIAFGGVPGFGGVKAFGNAARHHTHRVHVGHRLHRAGRRWELEAVPARPA